MLKLVKLNKPLLTGCGLMVPAALIINTVVVLALMIQGIIIFQGGLMVLLLFRVAAAMLVLQIVVLMWLLLLANLMRMDYASGCLFMIMVGIIHVDFVRIKPKIIMNM